MKNFLFLSAFSFMMGSMFAQPKTPDNYIPMYGNTYLTQGTEPVRRNSPISWSSPETIYSSWFKVTKTGDIKLFLDGKSEQPNTVITVKCLGKTFKVSLPDTQQKVEVGTVAVKKPGYVKVEIQGVQKSGEKYGAINGIIVEGEAATQPLHFVANFEPYWGLRGPSVHMKYTLPKEDVEYFYNEVTVPKGNDVNGSYYMANGFGEGYFGMQANSDTERRVLFSVWSPFDTQDPKNIPADQRIVNTQKGEGVHIGEFGNEGSGGQSFLRYNWKAGNTYRFLTRVHPDGQGNTEYTAWFYATDEKRWRLIASFVRPKTNTWYKGAHSFLENFIPEQGYITRKVLFSNQWARTRKGEWIELTEGYFTCDATGNAKVRMDYKGGVEKNCFFLQNCGFFNDTMPYGTVLNRKAKKQKPGNDLPLV